MSVTEQQQLDSGKEQASAALSGRGKVLVCCCSQGSVYAESVSKEVLALLAELGPNQVLTVDAMGQDLDAQVLPKSAGAPGGASSIFGSVLSARDGSSRRQLALDLGLDAEVVVIDDLCGLAARRDTRLGELLGSSPLTVAACHPRAVRWLLHRAGSEQAAEVELVNLRSSPPEEIRAALSARYGAEGSVSTLPGRDTWVPWFPIIDYDRCNSCGQCASFCLFGVFTTGKDGRPEVSRPESCKTNCPACARVCPEAAIIFPKLAEAPLNGGEVSEEQLAGAALKVDVDAMLGDDIYEALQQRRHKAKRRLLRKQALEQARAERCACSCSAGSQQDGLLTLQPGPQPGIRKDR